jgi:hypothetical protein
MGINALAIQNDSGADRILMGGYFDEIDSNQVFRLARLNANGSLDTNFVGRSNAEVVDLQLWRDGKFYTATDRSIERRLPDGTLDSAFTPVSRGSFDYFYSIAPHTDGSIVLLSARGASTLSPVIERFHPDGGTDTNFSVTVDRWPSSVAIQSDGGILLAGSFTNVNCIRRTYLARLIPSDAPDSLPCVPEPPKPEPTVTTANLPKRHIAVSWQADYPEYKLQAARVLRPRHPEKEKWVTVTNEPVCDEFGCSITNKIFRYGKHYRLVKP